MSFSLPSNNDKLGDGVDAQGKALAESLRSKMQLKTEAMMERNRRMITDQQEKMQQKIQNLSALATIKRQRLGIPQESTSSASSLKSSLPSATPTESPIDSVLQNNRFAAISSRNEALAKQLGERRQEHEQKLREGVAKFERTEALFGASSAAKGDANRGTPNPLAAKFSFPASVRASTEAAAAALASGSGSTSSPFVFSSPGTAGGSGTAGISDAANAHMKDANAKLAALDALFHRFDKLGVPQAISDGTSKIAAATSMVKEFSTLSKQQEHDNEESKQRFLSFDDPLCNFLPRVAVEPLQTAAIGTALANARLKLARVDGVSPHPLQNVQWMWTHMSAPEWNPNVSDEQIALLVTKPETEQTEHKSVILVGTMLDDNSKSTLCVVTRVSCAQPAMPLWNSLSIVPSTDNQLAQYLKAKGVLGVWPAQLMSGAESQSSSETPTQQLFLPKALERIGRDKFMIIGVRVSIYPPASQGEESNSLVSTASLFLSQNNKPNALRPRVTKEPMFLCLEGKRGNIGSVGRFCTNLPNDVEPHCAVRVGNGTLAVLSHRKAAAPISVPSSSLPSASSKSSTSSTSSAWQLPTKQTTGEDVSNIISLLTNNVDSAWYEWKEVMSSTPLHCSSIDPDEHLILQSIAAVPSGDETKSKGEKEKATKTNLLLLGGVLYSACGGRRGIALAYDPADASAMTRSLRFPSMIQETFVREGWSDEPLGVKRDDLSTTPTSSDIGTPTIRERKETNAPTPEVKLLDKANKLRTYQAFQNLRDEQELERLRFLCRLDTGAPRRNGQAATNRDGTESVAFQSAEWCPVQIKSSNGRMTMLLINSKEPTTTSASWKLMTFSHKKERSASFDVPKSATPRVWVGFEMIGDEDDPQVILYGTERSPSGQIATCFCRVKTQTLQITSWNLSCRADQPQKLTAVSHISRESVLLAGWFQPLDSTSSRVGVLYHWTPN